MRTIIAYIASASEMETEFERPVRLVDVSRLDVDDLPPQLLEAFRFPRLEAAVAAAPDDAELHLVLRQHGDFVGHPGTAPYAPFLTASQPARSRRTQVHVTPPVDSDGKFYAAFELLVDRWLEAGVRDIRVHLAGDSSADVMAAIAGLHGARVPEAVSYRHLEDDFARHAFERIVADHRISKELTREQAALRLEHWEFIEARALATVYPSDFTHVRELLDAAHAYLQRDEAPLSRLGMIGDRTDPQWRHTYDLAHALHLAEHATTVERDDEQIAWYVTLICLELGPMAWAERWLADRGLAGQPVEEAITSFTEASPEVLADGRRVMSLHGHPPSSADSHLAASLLQAYGPVTVRAGEAIDPGERRGDDPSAHAPALLWLALRDGLRESRNRLAHSFVDLDRDLLRSRVLEAGALKAVESLQQLLPSGSPAEPARDDLIELMDIDALVPGALDGDSSLLRRVIEVYSPMAARLDNPLVAVREQAMSALRGAHPEPTP